MVGTIVAFSFTFVIGVCLIGSLISNRYSVPLALDVGVAISLLSWLFFVVAFPWNLYFAAKKARFEAEESKDKEIKIAPEDYHTLKKFERWLLFTALSGHVVTSLIIHFMSSWSHGVVRPQFSYLFGCTILLRPSLEFYSYLRARLTELSNRISAPRNDSKRLKDILVKTTEELRGEMKHRQQLAETFAKKYDEVLSLVASEEEMNANYYHEEYEKLNQLSRCFDDVVHNVSKDDRDLVGGLRALAYLFRGRS